MTKAQYAGALDKLCKKASDGLTPLKLTTDIRTWKENGDQATKVTREMVTGFEALTPPKTLRDAAKRHNKATEQVAAAFQQAADAAKAGDVGKFSSALTRQQNYVILSRTAASELGALGCA